MKVQIEGNLYIEGDDRNIEVRKYAGRKDKKTDKELYTTHGYFKSVEQALDKVIKMKLAESQATTLKELSEDMKATRKWLEDKFK